MADTVFSKAGCKFGKKKPASLKAKLAGHTSLAVLIKRPQAEANRRCASISSCWLAGNLLDAIHKIANYAYSARADGSFYWKSWWLGCFEARGWAVSPPPAQHGDSAMRMRFWSENTRGLTGLTFRSHVEISSASAYRTRSTTRLPLQSPVTLRYHHAGRAARVGPVAKFIGDDFDG